MATFLEEAKAWWHRKSYKQRHRICMKHLGFPVLYQIGTLECRKILKNSTIKKLYTKVKLKQ